VDPALGSTSTRSIRWGELSMGATVCLHSRNGNVALDNGNDNGGSTCRENQTCARNLLGCQPLGESASFHVRSPNRDRAIRLRGRDMAARPARRWWGTKVYLSLCGGAEDVVLARSCTPCAAGLNAGELATATENFRPPAFVWCSSSATRPRLTSSQVVRDSRSHGFVGERFSCGGCHTNC
jgi:hypothetical protein